MIFEIFIYCRLYGLFLALWLFFLLRVILLVDLGGGLPFRRHAGSVIDVPCNSISGRVYFEMFNFKN